MVNLDEAVERQEIKPLRFTNCLFEEEEDLYIKEADQ